MILIDCEQGTPEWRLARLGRASASQIKDILAKPRSGTGESISRRNYRVTLALERVTGEPLEHFKSESMDWGNDTEDLARTAYMGATHSIVDQVGFAQHDTLMAGASPDGLVGTDGGIEIKCKIPANHFEGLELNRMPREHYAQVQGNLWIFERDWWDYVSFDPRFPPNAQLMIERIYRDDDYINYTMLPEMVQFLDEVAESADAIRAYRRGSTSAPRKATELTELFG